MRALRQLFFPALLAGLIAGGAGAAMHAFGTVPIILRAETFESASPAAPQVGHGTGHEANHGADMGATHDHDLAEREDGAGRAGLTLVADLLTGIGYAMLLVGAFALRGGTVTAGRGMLWGLAAFAVFTLGPGLGLPPELPGTAAAPLPDRQLWWAATAALTAGGLALIAFGRGVLPMLAGAALIVLPHLIGAPRPEEAMSLVPEALTHRFMLVATATSLVFWLLLGAVAGWLYDRAARRDAPRAPA